MKLTSLEKLLITGLKTSSVPKGKVAAILLHLKEEEQQLEMGQYMLEHQTATPEELLKVAQEIAARA